MTHICLQTFVSKIHNYLLNIWKQYNKINLYTIYTKGREAIVENLYYIGEMSEEFEIQRYLILKLGSAKSLFINFNT